MMPILDQPASTIMAMLRPTKRRIVVGMSGGVDSSVTAWLLKQQGYEVIGLFMKNWEDDDNSEYCSARQDLLDAASAADLVDVELETVNFATEYKDRVFANFLDEYSAGRTPNPDVLCNAEIKFKSFLDHALAMGAERIATGHYACVRAITGTHGEYYELLKGQDITKDQSYFLHRLTQAQLSRTLFPLGNLSKVEVRRLASKIGLSNATKKDSTGICFIGERPFRQFLSRYLPMKTGLMLTPEGQCVGKHQGLSFYTLGQRKGLGIGGVKGRQRTDGTACAWYAARKDIVANVLYVVQGRDHPWLLSDEVRVISPSWIMDVPLVGSELMAKTRYRQPAAHCRLVYLDEQSFILHFHEPQWAVTPGQSVVAYNGDVCLGGGIIA